MEILLVIVLIFVSGLIFRINIDESNASYIIKMALSTEHAIEEVPKRLNIPWKYHRHFQFFDNCGYFKSI